MSFQPIFSSKSLRNFLLSEYFLWLILAGLVSGRFLLALSDTPPEFIAKTISRYYFDLLLGVLVTIFPLLFLQIFGSTPLQAFRERKRNNGKEGMVIQGNNNIIHMPEDGKTTTNASEFDSEISAYLHRLARDSEDLAKKIYNRSGVYLIFGVLIAFSGIFYFAFQSLSISDEMELGPLLIALAPRFGILFFIEFIAFFFLKQYRAAMDEFRHYESVKRTRESQLSIYLMATETFSETDFSKVIDKINFFENSGRLSHGETTELIELSKQNNSEIEALSSIVKDVIKAGKNAA
ncbi:hypothetical protein ACMXYX_10085 [Neptuniibacter sp. QD72_48]|uniref:hypothetical protein n=1 Tax=Neptuniibacter sp. QD72_48 TaxID=3398214 RepID=UPI0039F50019